jgi:hypothetical protein
MVLEQRLTLPWVFVVELGRYRGPLVATKTLAIYGVNGVKMGTNE